MVAVSRNTCISISTPLPRKNIYYLLSLIHYLLSEVPGCANGFCLSAPLGYFCQSSQNEALKVRIIWGLLRRIFTVTALKMLAMEQPLLCFFPCHSKNTTQNSLINPNFQRLPKKTCFSYGARGNQNDGFAGEKPHFASIAPTVKLCRAHLAFGRRFHLQTTSASGN